MRKSFVARARVATRIFCSLAVLGAVECGRGATITNYFGATFEWRLHSLAVNVGDTVMWVSQEPLWAGTNFVESYGGEWKSPPLMEGDSFSFTFTNAGFYAYRTGVGKAGTVTVSGWTGAPPAVTINTPIEGSINQLWLQASVTNEQVVAEVQYFANSNFIGSATNPPYGVWWNVEFQPRTPYVLTAKALDRQGGATWSQPLNAVIEIGFDVWGERVLPTGELLFFYRARPAYDWIGAADNPLFTNYVLLARAIYSGVFVDETVRDGAVPRRFYGLIIGSGSR